MGLVEALGLVPAAEMSTKCLVEAINGRDESETHGPSPKRRNPSIKCKIKAGALIGTVGKPPENGERTIHHLRQAEQERGGAGDRGRKEGQCGTRPRGVWIDEIEEKIRARRVENPPQLANGCFSIVAARALLKLMQTRAQKEKNKEEVDRIEAIGCMLRDDFKEAFKFLTDTSK